MLNWKMNRLFKYLKPDKTISDERSSAKARLLVGAIDFGTTYSGWAFSFLHDFQTNPTNSSVKHWNSGSGSLVTEKAPTCVLIRPDGRTLEAFGYEAENRYRDLVEAGNHKDYYYYKRFKMLLNTKLDEKLNRQVTIKDNMGKSLPAMTVFSKTIEFLTNDMVNEAKKRLAGEISKQYINWVLTVPAIWTDSAKQFMREAAIEAGISTEQLVIALEPEAASILCRHLSVDMTVGRTDVSTSKFAAGTKYMVLDAGGGTIDITVHEVEKSGGLKEVHSASGGGWGGILVDEAFENLLIDLVGKDVYAKFVKEETEDWLDLWRDFEVKKKTISPEKCTRISMKFPMSLGVIFESTTNRKLQEAIWSSSYSNDVAFVGDKIKFEADVIRSVFDNSLKKTIGHVKMLMRDDNVKDVKAILMVGGYSDSPMLQHAVRSAFPGIHVIIPIDAVSSILRGAVIFGHSPKEIKERVLKYTYGVDYESTFKEGIHPESKKAISDSGEICEDLFSKHAERSQSITLDTILAKRKYTPGDRKQENMDFSIYASELQNPMYVDQGCTKIGHITVDLPDPDEDLERSVYVSFKFGGTEIEVIGEEKKTGKITAVTVDFLG